MVATPLIAMRELMARQQHKMLGRGGSRKWSSAPVSGERPAGPGPRRSGKADPAPVGVLHHHDRSRGFAVCGRIRASSPVPILLLTARAEDMDKVVGFTMGADDYLTKPFHINELVLRVKAILCRAATLPESLCCTSATWRLTSPRERYRWATRPLS